MQFRLDRYIYANCHSGIKTRKPLPVSCARASKLLQTAIMGTRKLPLAAQPAAILYAMSCSFSVAQLMPEHPEFTMASNSSGDYIARDEHLGQNTKQLPCRTEQLEPAHPWL